MDHVDGTIRGQSLARMFMPTKFELQDIVHQATGLGSGKAQCLRIVEQGLAILDPMLARGDDAVGDTLTIADAVLLHVERWTPRGGIKLPVTVRPHFGRMVARPAMRRVRRLPC